MLGGCDIDYVDVPGHDRPSNLSPHGQMPFLERLDFETRFDSRFGDA